MRKRTLSAAIVALATCAATFVAAQEDPAQYPTRPVEFVVPFAAGGSADVIARMVAQAVSQHWRQPVVVQDKPGATGAVASEYVAHAAPSGYTLLLSTASTHTVLPAYRHDLTYDTIRSFAPATLVATFPNMLVVNPRKVPVHTVAELIAYLKAHPGQLN